MNRGEADHDLRAAHLHLVTRQAGRISEAQLRGWASDPRRQVRQARGLVDDRVRDAEPVRPPLGLRGPRRARAAAGRTREERGVEQGLRLEDPPAAPRPGEQDPVRAAAPEAAGRRRAHLRAADLRPPGGKGRGGVGHFKGIMPVREKYSKNVGLFQTEVAQLNEVVHLWAYRDLNDRAAVRGKTLQDPEWQAFLAKATPLLVEMRSIALVPAPSSPMK